MMLLAFALVAASADPHQVLGGSLIAAATPLDAAPREPTDLMIRRLAGLPASSADGEIEIIDVGHGGLDTMLSIVASRTDAGWTVSYACAESPHCAAGADNLARSYIVSSAASAQIDQLMTALRTGEEPDGQAPSPTFISGNLLAMINYKGFKHDYRRAGYWGHTLGQLETLLKNGNP